MSLSPRELTCGCQFFVVLEGWTDPRCNPSKSSHAAQIFSPDYYRPHRWRSWSWLPKEKVRAEAR
ncbi:MAG: hypothetical protein ABSD28_15470, partial [Tepidisphaeraceae bacterium]